ncbi:hypothetical protein QCD79_34215, partial [Pseudomonas quasicaspiana]|nr:hypothetical protein [Pseudomonas quasicaspiana]
VVGCGNATQLLQDGQGVTVSCAEGDTGYIFEGELGFEDVTGIAFRTGNRHALTVLQQLRGIATTHDRRNAQL